MMFLDRAKRLAQVPLAQEDERLTDLSNVPLGVGIAQWTMRGCLEDAELCGFQYSVQSGQACVPVVNEIPTRQFPILEHHGEVPGLLLSGDGGLAATETHAGRPHVDPGRQRLRISARFRRSAAAHGLGNFRQRMKEIGGSIEQRSQAGGRPVTTLIVPLTQEGG
jgi:hypothetical protein